MENNGNFGNILYIFKLDIFKIDICCYELSKFWIILKVYYDIVI